MLGILDVLFGTGHRQLSAMHALDAYNESLRAQMQTKGGISSISVAWSKFDDLMERLATTDNDEETLAELRRFAKEHTAKRVAAALQNKQELLAEHNIC